MKPTLYVSFKSTIHNTYHVGRCVIPSQSVLTHQKSENKYVHFAVNAVSIVSIEMGENKLCASSMLCNRRNGNHENHNSWRIGRRQVLVMWKIKMMGPLNQIQEDHDFWPKRFHAAAICPKKDRTEIGRLFMIAWRSNIPPWKAMTTYFDASYPPPFFPPVPRRMTTLIISASEKSILVVTAHCKWNKGHNHWNLIMLLHLDI